MKKSTITPNTDDMILAPALIDEKKAVNIDLTRLAPSALSFICEVNVVKPLATLCRLSTAEEPNASPNTSLKASLMGFNTEVIPSNMFCMVLAISSPTTLRFSIIPESAILSIHETMLSVLIDASSLYLVMTGLSALPN